jgi:hypothetical protein
MLARRAGDPLTERLDTDEVGQERVREIHAQRQVHRVLPRLPPPAPPRPLARLALEEALDGTEEKLHVHRLRAGDEHAQHEQGQQHRVRRVEHAPEEREHTVGDVQLDHRPPADPQVRNQREKRDQNVRDNATPTPEPAP